MGGHLEVFDGLSLENREYPFKIFVVYFLKLMFDKYQNPAQLGHI
jgi:hypothetical protein